MVRALHARDVFLLVTAVIGTASTALAQIPLAVRTLNPTPVVRWVNASRDDIILTIQPGTTLEVLDKVFDRKQDWYWIITPADVHGTSRAGWINAADAEAVERVIRTRSRSDSSATGASGSAASSAAATLGSASASTTSSTTTAVTSTSAAPDIFTDVHFALNQASLTAEQADILDRAATVLKDDPLLQVNVEGYTCSLGTPAHNLLLGKRRATTVSEYLVSKGVSADRLHTVSFGEDHAKYDNSTESSRQLNRRVAIVPAVQP